ncbi:SDR family NAD(P)-dependent oxidoreductase [Cellulosimicrobium cellulans]|uniref:SDR family NAD(P)-dependent oxidoreductase n=1 Tax=Cellulosimicrobium cellulans TaxID=1710 RepID=UPI000316B8E4|nr:SDR family NAD(P)-dependent oxidoreductase [Cellulosimicrobium cellulans]
MALVLVTGASTGLGLATATALARGGHDVVLHARTRSRLDGLDVRGQMRGIVLGDLSHPQETADVAEQANTFGRFDAVVHNAGVMDSTDTLAVNVLAPYLLTASMPLPGRAIFLSSSMHLSGRPDLRPVHTGAEASYSDSKLLVTTLALALARRYTSTLSHAVDPGWVPTRMGGSSAPDDLTEGHRTQTWLAAAPVNEISPTTGGYWHHRVSRRPHPAAMDSGFQSQLLDALATRTHLALPAADRLV